jgi:hypothetical protein
MRRLLAAPFAVALLAALAGAAPVSAAEPTAPPTMHNATRVKGLAHTLKVWPPGTLHELPEPAADQTLYSLVLDVKESGKASPVLPNFQLEGKRVPVFSDKELGEELEGRTVEATLELVGDDRGRRWMIRDLAVVPESAAPAKKSGKAKAGEKLQALEPSQPPPAPPGSGS